MKTLVCLHGNPSEGLEFSPLLPALRDKGFNPVVHRRPIRGSKLEPLLQSISATAKVSGGSPFGLLAYSWGAYLALSYLKRFPENITGIVLINPLLVDHKPLTVRRRILLGVPLLRTISLKIGIRSFANDYLQTMFLPHIPSEPIKKYMEPFLYQSLVWRGAASYKQLMQQTPLPEHFKGITNPVFALFGEQDAAAPYKPQLDILQRLPQGAWTRIKGAGHALPWTNPQTIIDRIEHIFSNH